MDNINFDELFKTLKSKQKPLTIALGLIVVLIAGGYYLSQILLPEREAEAQDAMFMAQINFEKKNFDLALNGDSKYKGFNYVKDNFSFTKAANLAGLYAGLCNLNLGKYDKAIDDLKGYSTDVEEVQAVAYGALGDAYSEKNNMKEAVVYYEKAAKATKNTALAPRLILKAGKAFELVKDNEKALEMYKYLEQEFPGAEETQFTQLLIAKLEAI
ncbi:MAG: tetratricopeptide repeat protein [Chitinophagales bacterium]|nr:tetratricopeptide repeat protein [Chitinophagales bacterium]